MNKEDIANFWEQKLKKHNEKLRNRGIVVDEDLSNKPLAETTQEYNESMRKLNEEFKNANTRNRKFQ